MPISQKLAHRSDSPKPSGEMTGSRICLALSLVISTLQTLPNWGSSQLMESRLLHPTREGSNHELC